MVKLSYLQTIHHTPEKEVADHMIPRNQLELVDVFSECRDIFEADKPKFLSLLEEHIDLSALIPRTFTQNYYSHTGRPRTYPLSAMLWALILQRILSIPTDSLLILYSCTIQDTSGSSVALTRFRMLPKLPGLSRILRMTLNISSSVLSTTPNRSASQLTLPWPV